MRSAAAAPPGKGGEPVPRLQRGLDRLVVLVMLLGFYYSWYRYPFQINSTDTSPTYADTPAWLAMGKYLVLAGLLVWMTVWRAAGPEVRVRPVVFVSYVYLALAPVAAGIAVGRTELVEVGLFFLVPLLLFTFSGWRVSAPVANRVLAWAIVLGVAANAVQVALFFAVGRLPALAHKNTFSVRFGGFLDDPNGWGILSIWMIFFAAHYWTGWRRAVLVSLLFVGLLLTQSLTAAGAFVVTLAVFGTITIFSRAATLFRATVATLALFTVFLALLVAFYDPIDTAYRAFMESKAGSISQHAESLDVFRLVSPLNLLGLQPLEQPSEESGYVNMLANLGVIYTLAFVVVGAGAIWRYFLLMRGAGASREVRAFAAGGLALLVAMYSGNLVLPYMEGYPINLFSALFLGLASGGLLPLPEGGASRVRRGARRGPVRDSLPAPA